MNTRPITIERTFSAPKEKVWKAISDRNEMERWYFNLKDFKPEVGFEFSFMGGPPEKQYKHNCQVTEVLPGNKLTYSWRSDGYPGISYVSCELIDLGNKTRVVLTHSNLESFPSEEKAFAKENFVQGWTDII